LVCYAEPSMASEGYIHGYSREEQERLVGQAEYWRDSLILPAVRARAGQSLLDIGCGAGAVLGVIARGCPGVRVAGIDVAAEQIAYARRYLADIADVDLRQGDAARLPWEDASFDHVFMMWFLEHVTDSAPFLAEARRVLRPGGSITVIETDYDTFFSYPTDPDLEALMAAQRELFRRNGQPAMGRQLGTLLAASGFRQVESGPVGFHHFAGGGGTALRDFATYLLGFLEPMVPRAARELELDEQRLRAGAAFLRALPERPMASLTQLVFRGWALR
jgi:ubiquinone/menaquinone biosynthesis C-methylase UbiE